MGNGQSRDGFAGILPAAKVAERASESKDAVSAPISETWTASSPSPSPGNDGKQAASSSVGDPLLLHKIESSAYASERNAEDRRGADEAERFLVPESVRKSRTLDAFADVCSEILPGFLYVSNLLVARDAAKLEALGITHIVNCCGELQAESETLQTSRQVLRLALRDDASEDLTPFLPQVLEFIAQGGATGKVLVHCHQGISRSCAFAIAFVMLERPLTFHEAAAFVKRQRAISSPNAAFICQLLEWEKAVRSFAASGGSCSTPGILDGLYRLTPHAPHDAGCLVLKRCYHPSQQRREIVRVQSLEDERRLLWSQGAFVFLNPANPHELIVWRGANCRIPDAMAIARKQAERLIRLQTRLGSPDSKTQAFKALEVQKPVDKHQETVLDCFGYAEELAWGFSPSTTSQVARPANEAPSDAAQSAGTESEPPLLFILEAMDEWDQVTNYDSEDLASDSAFLLCLLQSQGAVKGYVWLGSSCDLPVETVLLTAQTHIQRLIQRPPNTESPSSMEELTVERQSQESDAFWQLFEAGY
ncbi:hypothetical protein BBJ28_00004346 [Nothophytophthora sp. Chile5]|nr:hypothetical protein BBJ28_00004346 [Nothophytophthora sp. Chile5]